MPHMALFFVHAGHLLSTVKTGRVETDQEAAGRTCTCQQERKDVHIYKEQGRTCIATAETVHSYKEQGRAQQMATSMRARIFARQEAKNSKLL